ncbi:MAG: hypothetical protein L0387_46020, partial [Acidobacteria bacterium]|nr:hypothetical protein [Acidobacteriota bacterium]
GVGGMNIELHIEELVLRGIDGGMQHEIRAAMERKLVGLLGGEGMVTSLSQRGDVSRLDAGSFKVKSRANGQVIGVQLAQTVYRGIVG